MSDFSGSWYGMKETPDIGVTAMGGSLNKKGKVDNYAAHYSLIMQLEHVHGWLENKGAKKLSHWAHELMEHTKVAQEAPEYLRADMLRHLDSKKKLLREKANNHIAHKDVFDEFIKLLKKAFPSNRTINKRITATIKLHEQFLADAKKAKELVK